MTKTDPSKIAAGLSAAHRTALLRGTAQYRHIVHDLGAMGLIYEWSHRFGRYVELDSYTPLGLAVRRYLQEQDQ